MADLTYNPKDVLETNGGATEPEQEMIPAARLLLGGVAGMTPMLITLGAGQYQNIPIPGEGSALGYDQYYLGMLLKAVTFFALGALVVWLHTTVRTRYAVFRLGVTAPALFAAYLGASEPAEASGLQSGMELNAPQARMASVEPAALNTVMSDAMLPPVFQQRRECSILDGFLGRKCE
jgi:hypothetical protein